MDVFPRLQLDLDALEHNVEAGAGWSQAADVDLWPHAKTTMCRPVVARQLAAGASGLTVATPEQAAIVAPWGAPTVLVANQVVDPAGVRTLAEIQWEHPDVRLLALVDSVEGARLLDREAASHGAVLEVLLDVGMPGGRTGVRTETAARAVARCTTGLSSLRFAGVAAYEGVVPNRRDARSIDAVDELAARSVDLHDALAAQFETARPVFTMGGSAFPDRVLAARRPSAPWTVTALRSGCYVTHDHGTYAAVSPIPGLVPALSVLVRVLSTPEPHVAVLGAGKRELPHDMGWPVLLARGALTSAATTDGLGTVAAMYDHHTVVHEASSLAVGDVVRLGISHPCSAFSRWPTIDVVSAGTTVDTWTTQFHAAP
jgi:D-serine deaminase-like pyridoxal phosphate-dependent protein